MKTWTVVMISLLLFPWAVQSAEFYRWTDENGVSHVTDQPPTETGKNVKTYRFPKPAEPVSPKSQDAGETPGAVAEGQPLAGSETGQPAENQLEQDRNQALEKARQEYEEAKSHETEYRRNYNDSYGYGKDRKAWRGKLEDIENKRQKLESLESGGSSGGETASSNSPEDQTPR